MFNYSVRPSKMVEVLHEAPKSHYCFNYEGYTYKLEEAQGESVMRSLASHLLHFSSFPQKDILDAEYGVFGSQKASRWKQITKDDESYVNLYDFFMETEGADYMKVTAQMSIPERWDYLIAYFKEKMGLDLTDYMRNVVTLDMHLLNYQKVLKDMYVIAGPNGYREAPLMSGVRNLILFQQGYNPEEKVADNLRVLSYDEIDERLHAISDYFGIGFLIDRKQAVYQFAALPEGKERNLLLHRLVTLDDAYFSSGTYDYLIEKYKRI